MCVALMPMPQQKNRTYFSANMSKWGKEIAVSVVCYMPVISQIAECILFIYMTNIFENGANHLVIYASIYIYIVFWLLYASFLQPEFRIGFVDRP